MADSEPTAHTGAGGESGAVPRPGTAPSPSTYAVELPYAQELQAMLEGKYLVEGFLGQGGMGAVYRGLQLPLKRPVAIKILARRTEADDYGFEDRFKREAYAMAALTHPNIVQVYDCGEAGPNFLFISMELVEGGDLSEALKAGRLAPEVALKMLLEICNGIQAAHDHGLVHRDIKPANIFLTPEGRAKVADFGLAKKFDSTSTFVTKTGLGMGTPDYAAPEQYEAVADIDHRADIYSLGVMMYQMLTGKLPRGAAFKTPSQIAGVDARIDAVVAKAMAAERAERYQSVREIRQELERIMSTPQSAVRAAATASAAVPTRAVPSQSSPRRSVYPPGHAAAGHAVQTGGGEKRFPAVILIAVLAAVAVVVGGMWYMRQGGADAGTPVAEKVAPEVPAASLPPSTPAVSSQPAAPAEPRAVAAPTPAPRATPPEAPAEALSFGGSRYLLVADTMSWDKANAKAKDMGGHLVTVTSSEEDDWIRATFGDRMKAGMQIWLGGSSTSHEKGAAWVWSNGERWSFSNWAGNQPDFGYGGDGHPRYQMWAGDLKWDDGAGNAPASFLVEWDGPQGGGTSAPVVASSPAPTPPAVPDWLAEARKRGGKVHFFGTGPHGATETAGAESYQDAVELAVRTVGWVLRRASGETHVVAWGKPTDKNPTGATTFGPFPVSRITHGATVDMLLSSDHSYRNLWGGTSLSRDDLAHKDAYAVGNIFDHQVVLDREGNVLKSTRWNREEYPVPDGVFKGAVAFAGFGGSYLIARPGALVRRWQVWDNKLSDFPEAARDVVDIHAAGGIAILLTAEGRVLVTDESGKPIPKAAGKVPDNLGPAIAVRVGSGMCAAQMTDGTWVAWGDSQKLIDQTKAMGPALDVGYDHQPSESSKFMVWIEASSSSGSATMAAGAQGQSQAAPASPSSDVAVRLGEIAAQFQTAYDRDIAPAHNAAVADLDAKYLAAVDRALDAATKAGNLDDVLKLQAEAQRVKEKGRLPTADLDSVPESLKKLRDTYRVTLAKLEKDRDAKAKPYYDRHDALLSAYQKELTQQNRLDDATKVSARREELANERKRNAAEPDEAASSATPAPKPNAGAPQVPVPAKPIKLPKGATRETAIAEVFRLGGRMDIRVDGKFTGGIASAADLPKEAFEITYVGLDAQDSDITDESLALLSLIPTLEKVSVVGAKVAVTSLAPLGGLKKLKSLSIGIYNEGVDSKELEHLAELTELESLRISIKNRMGEGCEALRGLANLKSLHLFGSGRLSSKGAESIATLTQLTELRMCLPDRASQSRMGPIASLPNLEEFGFSNCEVTVEGMANVARLPKLKTLLFGGVSDYAPHCFAALAPAAARLKMIDIQFSRGPNDDHLKDIATVLPNLESYSVLYVGRNEATGEGLRELAKLPRLNSLGWCGAKREDYAILTQFPALEWVRLTGKAITDEVFAHLRGIPGLKRVEIYESSATKGGAEQFKKERPGIVVSGL